MKKAFLTVLAATLVLGATNVSAMTEAQLREKLTQEYTVNGETFKADASMVAYIDQYLNDFEISAEDAQAISNAIDEAVKIVKEDGAKSFSKLSTDSKEKVIALANKVSSDTAIKVTLSNDGKLTVYEPNSNDVFAVVTDIIKYTDNSAILMVAGIVSVLGIAVVTRKIAKANA